MLHTIRLLGELNNLTAFCNRCGMCQMHCPVFKETKKETDVARGKLSLIDGLASEILSQPEKVLAHLNKCLLCGACSSGCSRNVKTIEIFIKARIILAQYKGLSFTKKFILNTIVSNPALFDKIISLLKKTQHLFFKAGATHHSAVTPRLYMPFLRGRQLQALSPFTFHETIEATGRTKELKHRQKNIIFFAGCLIDKIMPEVGLDCLKALHHHDVNVLTFNEEGCCGIPSLASGDLNSFNRLVEHNTEVLGAEGIDGIVTACATCTYTISRLWPMIYAGDKQAEVNAVAEKTTDITRFITSEYLSDKDNPEPASGREPKRLTIHDPCHLKKSLGIFKEPRKLVQQNQSYQFTEMDSPDSCCGFGGTFNLSNYELSSDIAKNKCDAIEKCNAATIATGCPACMLQLKDQLAKNHQNVTVKHVMEIYADTLK